MAGSRGTPAYLEITNFYVEYREEEQRTTI
jgi:hypothetical protein